jgi:AcrR family transcriptional regulator
MRALGDQLGIKAPSLYKHFISKDALRAALAGTALAESGVGLHSVVDAGGGVVELLDAYRQQAHANPHLYRLATTGRLPRADLPAGLEEWSGAPFFLVTGEDPHLAQALWSLAHGMTILELDQRYPSGSAPEESWQAAADLFTTRLDRHSGAHPDA